MVIFAFALDEQNVLDTVAPGLVWLATMFSLLISSSAPSAVEADDGALDAMRVAGVDARAIFFGKAIGLGASCWCSKCCCCWRSESSCTARRSVWTGCCAPRHDHALRDVRPRRGRYPVRRLGRGVQGPRDTAPAAHASGGCARPDRSNQSGRIRPRHAACRVSDGWQWVSLLTVFAVAAGVGGALAFGPLIDD